MMSFTEEKNDGAVYAGQPKDKDFIIKGLGEQNERLYQNQMSIVETNNVLIKRLQEQQATIERYKKALEEVKNNINGEKWSKVPLRLYDKVGTINNIVNQALEESDNDKVK